MTPRIVKTSPAVWFPTGSSVITLSDRSSSYGVSGRMCDDTALTEMKRDRQKRPVTTMKPNRFFIGKKGVIGFPSIGGIQDNPAWP
ncbi:hypothetical protein [Methanoregula sp.]|uniref:hypothetical protein n=1 Tax=Methanoregula sp. TaxID=2052170 RepID=UPI0026027F08|nr:hypothetical protein [Methanoregula sp.]MDD5143110.1 hypothetical protein [Methanoregula sp.]